MSTHSRPAAPASSRLTTPTREEISARARQLWQIAGSPPGRDLEFWLGAEAEVAHERDETSRAADANGPAQPDTASRPGSVMRSTPAKLSVRNTAAAHLSDPLHKLHEPGAARDHRLDVVQGEARQRVRGRRLGGSLRAQPKKKR